jgi:membrane protease YdiL (CAAX protease family)
MARRHNDSVVLEDTEWSTVWRCQCGYGNTGRDKCLMCSCPAPEEIIDRPGLRADDDFVPLPRDPDGRAGGRATRTVAGIIGVNLVMQVLMAIAFVAGGVDRATAVKVSLFTGLAYYAMAALWVLARSASLGLRPWIGRESAAVGAAEGFVVGGAGAVFLVGALRLALGHPVLDPSAALLASQGSIGALVLGFLVIVVAAPVVEELVFRGFLAESLRRKGRWAAVVLSAVAFSLAHLSLIQFRYYLVMGMVFGFLYWRRGLVGSIAAHAAFNGILMVVAVAAAHGPGIAHDVAGGKVAIPATYRTSTAIGGADLAAIGPLGAHVEFDHFDGPGVTAAPQIAERLVSGALALPPQFALRVSSVTMLELPAGEAVQVMATIDGEDGRVVMLPTAGRLWVASFTSDGGSGSSFDFDEMLRSWRLPSI